MLFTPVSTFDRFVRKLACHAFLGLGWIGNSCFVMGQVLVDRNCFVCNVEKGKF